MLLKSAFTLFGRHEHKFQVQSANRLLDKLLFIKKLKNSVIQEMLWIVQTAKQLFCLPTGLPGQFLSH